MKTLDLFLFILLFFAAQNIHAQFTLNGSAVQVNDTCWTLTPNQEFTVGSIWNNDKISLAESFQVLMQLKFGSLDANGADGILFGLQPLSTSIGEPGEGLGFQGVAPSLGVEFDTWQNFNLSDPSFDHLAIMKNGILNHSLNNNLAGPVQANSFNANIEDGQWHQLRVDWEVTTQTLSVWFDCEPRLTYTGDIVNEIFNGDPEVFWGFTAATGGATNVQQVCFTYLTFLNGFEDVVICPEGQFQLGVTGGISYKWTPEEGLSNPNIPNPIASPEQTTTYVVEVTDACNNPFSDSLTVFIDGDTVFFDLGLDTTFCEGTPYQLDATSTGTTSVDYQWSNGATTPILDVTSSGFYEVTVTIDDYCVADDRVEVNVLPLPGFINFGPDVSLCLGQTLLLDANASGNPSYEWQDGSTQPTFLVDAPGTYTAYLSNNCGERESSIRVDYEDCRQIYFPNIFSPNGDGINDVFLPFDSGDVEQVLQFKIFDRWGGQVHESFNFPPNEFEHGWDGTVKGELANPGLYAWFAEVNFRDGVVEILEGEVTIVR